MIACGRTRRWAHLDEDYFEKRRRCCCPGATLPTPEPPPTVTPACCPDVMPREFVGRLLITGGIESTGCTGDITARGVYVWTAGAGPAGLDGYLWEAGPVCDLDFRALVYCDPSQASDPVTRGWFVQTLWDGLNVPSGGGGWIVRPCDDPDGFEYTHGQSSLALPRPGSIIYLTAGNPS